MLHLIGPLPQGAIGRVRGLRQRQHADHRQYGHHRAAAKRQQGQQHHRQHQPIAFIEPGLAAIGLGGFIGQRLLRRIEHAQGAQVHIVRRDACIPPAALRSQGAQTAFVELGLRNLAAGHAIRCAAFAAHAKRRDTETARTCHPCRTLGGAICAIADKQDLALLEAGLLQQLRGRIDRPVCTLAIDRHHRRRQRIQKQGHVGAVLGQWRNRETLACIDQQCHLATGTFAQQRRQLGARLQQARRRQVGCIGTGRQIQHHHQRHARLKHRTLGLPPTRPAHRNHCQRIGQRSQHESQPSAPTAGGQ